MHFLSFIISTIFLSLIGCSDHANEHGSLHVHQPLRGGVLYELGKHGSGHNFELVTNEKGQLELFVLDAHAENYVRILQKQIDLQIINPTNSTKVLPLHAIADPATGETVGNTSLFRSTSQVTALLPLSATMSSLKIGNSDYEKVSIEFSGNPQP